MRDQVGHAQRARRVRFGARVARTHRCTVACVPRPLLSGRRFRRRHPAGGGCADRGRRGCSAARLLTGRRLFDDELFERLEAHLNREPPTAPATPPLRAHPCVPVVVSEPAPTPPPSASPGQAQTLSAQTWPLPHWKSCSHGRTQRVATVEAAHAKQEPRSDAPAEVSHLSPESRHLRRSYRR